MKLQKFRWSKVYESSEEELLDFLSQRGIVAERFDGAEMTEQALIVDEQPLTLWCAEGSLTLVASGTEMSLQPGDGVKLPVADPYHLRAGISGYVLYRSR